MAENLINVLKQRGDGSQKEEQIESVWWISY